MDDIILRGEPNCTRLILYRNHYNEAGLLVGMEAIKELASEDVVEVVRCKDCIWYGASDELCLREGMSMSEEDYCSYGKRKDE